MEASGIVPGSQQFRRNWKRFMPWRIAPRFTTFLDFPPSWLDVKWSSKLWQPKEVENTEGMQGGVGRREHSLSPIKKWDKNSDEYSLGLNPFLTLMHYLEDNRGIFTIFTTSMKQAYSKPDSGLGHTDVCPKQFYYTQCGNPGSTST